MRRDREMTVNDLQTVRSRTHLGAHEGSAKDTCGRIQVTRGIEAARQSCAVNEREPAHLETEGGTRHPMRSYQGPDTRLC
jgi:hypothetical protein